jgi:type VI secretion system secreted protein Hcp
MMPSLRSIRLLLFTATLLLIGSPAFADNYFLSIPTIPGESLSTGHPNTIEAYSFSLNCTNSGAGVVFGDFAIVKALDKASPPLFLATAQGTLLGTQNVPVTFYVQKNTGTATLDYYIIKLTNAKVSSVVQNGNGADRPTETVTFRYQRIEIDYIGQNLNTGQPLPAVVMKWDLTTNATF